MEYTFNDKEHVHLLDGRPLIGVTSALRIINKPFLIQWAVNMAVSYIKENAIKEELPVPEGDDKTEFQYIVNDKILKGAMKSHDKIKRGAGDWGTKLHKAVENWVKLNMEPELEGELKVAFDNFREWVKENNIEFLQSEKHVWSEKLWIGGILDLIIRMDGKKYIADIKTSSGIYNEAFFQMGAYNLCLEDMGENGDIDGYLIINLKKDGTMDLKIATDMEMNKRAFLSALELYKITESIIN